MKTVARFLLIAALVFALVLAASGAAFASPLKLVLPDNIPVKDNYTRVENEEGQEKLLDYADDLVRSEKYKKLSPLEVASGA